MCGRYTNQYTWKELHALYSLSDEIFPTSNFPPRYNIAPTQLSFVVRENGGRRELAEFRWGLLPSWAKSPGDGARMINARSETVESSRAYRDAFQLRPCLVVADGFYEWQKLGGAEKQPFYITTQFQEPFAFAGLWEPKTIADHPTYTLLTAAPNELCAPIHDRMPVMLPEESWSAWLGPVERRKDLVGYQFPAERMECWPVGRAVGNVKNDAPILIERATQ